MTKRFKKEQEQLLRYEGQDLARDILPVVDNLTRALQTEVEDAGSKQLSKGSRSLQEISTRPYKVMM